MSKRLSETTGVVLVMFFFFAGCEQSAVRDESDEAVGLDPETVSAPSGFAAEAFDAAGGLEAWTEAKKLAFDCVVAFYEPDGSFYLTEQSYVVYPWSETVDILGREPKGGYAWRFSNGQMSELQSDGQIVHFPTSLERPCFAQAILAIASAPVHFLGPSARFNRQDAAVKKQGQWYYPIHQTGKRSGQAVFYQNRDTLLVDMIRVSCSGANKPLTVRGYDYRRIAKGGPIVPARIEIFSTDAAGFLQERLVKMDCHTMALAK